MVNIKKEDIVVRTTENNRYMLIGNLYIVSNVIRRYIYEDDELNVYGSNEDWLIKYFKKVTLKW